MRGVVEVPLLINTVKNVGMVKIDRKGRMKVEMSSFIRPEEMRLVLDFIKNLADSMSILQPSRTDIAKEI